MDPDPSKSKTVRKILIPTLLKLLLDFSTLEKTFIYYFFLLAKIAGSGSKSGSRSISRRHGSADSDPDPSKMSWIRPKCHGSATLPGRDGANSNDRNESLAILSYSYSMHWPLAACRRSRRCRTWTQRWRWWGQRWGVWLKQLPVKKIPVVMRQKRIYPPLIFWE